MLHCRQIALSQKTAKVKDKKGFKKKTIFHFFPNNKCLYLYIK